MNENSENDEILTIFREEAAEHLQQAGDCLLRLEREHDANDVDSLFRSLHTIKGNALMLGFENIASLSHACENVVSKVRSGTLGITKQLVDITFLVLDTIKAMLGNEKIDGLDELVSGLNAIAAGKSSPQDIMHRKPPSPRIQADAAEQTIADPAPPEPGLPLPDPGKLSILVVEDDFITRKIMVQQLRQYGSCDIAVDGEEALDAFAQSLAEKPYDIVFLDIMMPRKDGFETAKGIRALELQDTIKKMGQAGRKVLSSRANPKQGTIIVMTSTLDDSEHYLNACYRCGADTYLVKPVEAGMLSDIFSQYTWRRTATA
jgi:two-component system chemotaxis response regulator CheY